MRHATTVVSIIGLLAVALFAVAGANAQRGGDKVTICHATGSSGNPFVAITVSVTAGDLTGALAKSGHFDPNGNTESGHEQDFFLEGDQPKSACQGTQTPPPTPDPTGV